MEFYKPSVAYNLPLLLAFCGDFASQNHGLMTWFMKNAITQQSNGLWSLKKLHKLNNIHYYLPAKSCCDRSGASFLLIFCLTTHWYFDTF